MPVDSEFVGRLVMPVVTVRGAKAKLDLLTLGKVGRIHRGWSHACSEQHLNGCVKSQRLLNDDVHYCRIPLHCREHLWTSSKCQEAVAE